MKLKETGVRIQRQRYELQGEVSHERGTKTNKTQTPDSVAQRRGPAAA